MAKVLIENLLFYGFHGVYEYEREQGQKFFYDVEYVTDDGGVAEDDIAQAVDYVSICDIVRDIAENKRFRLLEALAAHICEAVLGHSTGILSVTVRVRKPAVPIHTPINYVQVEETRSR